MTHMKTWITWEYFHIGKSLHHWKMQRSVTFHLQKIQLPSIPLDSSWLWMEDVRPEWFHGSDTDDPRPGSRFSAADYIMQLHNWLQKPKVWLCSDRPTVQKLWLPRLCQQSTGGNKSSSTSTWSRTRRYPNQWRIFIKWSRIGLYGWWFRLWFRLLDWNHWKYSCIIRTSIYNIRTSYRELLLLLLLKNINIILCIYIIIYLYNII